MGFYIETPVVKGKAAWLIDNAKAKVIDLEQAEQILTEDPDFKTHVVICVVTNIPFDAAGFAYSHRELADFMNPRDVRPKTLLAVPTTKDIERILHIDAIREDLATGRLK